MITAIYAGLLGLILLGLSIKVIGERRRTGIAIGDGDNALLRRRMRVQANFCEYAPIAVVLIALA